MRYDEIELDPLSIVRAKLWEVVEANPFFAEWVRAGNRVRYDNELGEKDTGF